jgi:hypothetical protein
MANNGGAIGMRLAMKLSASLFTVLVVLFLIPHISSATLAYGIATDGSGTKVGDYWNEKIRYYIPLKSGTPPSGVYGVDGGGSVGRVSDGAKASEVDGWLWMYIEFLQPFDYPAQTASATFWFRDLDLLDDNDPAAFRETVQFSIWNEGTSVYDPVTGVITDAGMDTSSEIFSIIGNNDNRYITFDDVTSYLPSSGSFKWLLQFTTDYAYETLNGCYDPCLWNTKEKLYAKLETSPVPEPATMLLLGSGLIAIAGVGRKKILEKREPNKS